MNADSPRSSAVKLSFGFKLYWTSSELVESVVVDLVRAIEAVHKESIKQDTRNIKANHPVKVFNTSAVDVPNTDSPVSPPKDAPNPVVLLSWIKITKHRTTQRITNKVNVRKYKKVM